MVPLVQHTMHTLWHYALTDMDNSRKAFTTGVDVVGLAQDVLSLCRARSIIISSSSFYLLPPLHTTLSLGILHTSFYFSLHTFFYFYIFRLFYSGILIADSVLTTTTAPLSADIDVRHVSLAIAFSSPGRWMV